MYNLLCTILYLDLDKWCFVKKLEQLLMIIYNNILSIQIYKMIWQLMQCITILMFNLLYFIIY